MTEYLSLRRRPEFFNLRLRLRPPNFLAENFHLSRRFRKLCFFPLIDPRVFKMAFFWVYKVVTTEIQQSKTLPFSKGKLAVTNKWLQKSRISYLMHSNSLLGLLKEISYLRLRLRPSAECLIFLKEKFGFGLLSKIGLRSYSALLEFHISFSLSWIFLIFLSCTNSFG